MKWMMPILLCVLVAGCADNFESNTARNRRWIAGDQKLRDYVASHSCKLLLKDNGSKELKEDGSITSSPPFRSYDCEGVYVAAFYPEDAK
jgi:hypothetical protein